MNVVPFYRYSFCPKQASWTPYCLGRYGNILLKQNEDWTNGNWTESPTDKLTTSAPEQMMRNGKTPISVLIKILSHFSSHFSSISQACCTQPGKACKKQNWCCKLLGSPSINTFFLGVPHYGHPIPMPSSLGADYQGHDPPWSIFPSETKQVHIDIELAMGIRQYRGNHVESYMVANELKQRPSCTFVSRWVAFGHGHHELPRKPAPQLREKKGCGHFLQGNPTLLNDSTFAFRWFSITIKHCLQTPACRSRPNTVTLPLPERTPCRWPACKVGYGSYGP